MNTEKQNKRRTELEERENELTKRKKGEQRRKHNEVGWLKGKSVWKFIEGSARNKGKIKKSYKGKQPQN